MVLFLESEAESSRFNELWKTLNSDLIIYGILFVLSRNFRIEKLDYLLKICESREWNVDTPNIAGKIETLLKPFRFTRRTNRDYVCATIDMLQSRKSGTHSSELVQLE